MKSLHVARVFGIDIRIDPTALVIIALVAWIVSASVLPDVAPGYSTAAYWAVGAAAAGIFFASLLAHEVGHAVVARRHGIVVRDITLWLLGGVAQIESEPERPDDELKIAAAGPLTSAAIGVAALGAAVVVAGFVQSDLVVAALTWLGVMNLMLAAFNLFPASPLDGGRLLRAWLWRRHGDRARAARSAARSGEMFGRVLIALGVFEFLFGVGFGGLWTILIGWFVLSAARNEESRLALEDQLVGVRVRDVMTADPITVRETVGIAEFLDQYVIGRRCSAFPVVDGDGEVVGLATLSRARSVPATARAQACVGEIAWPLTEVTTAAPDEPLATVLGRIRGGDGRVLVFDAGHLVGIVSPTDVARTIQVAAAQPPRDSRQAA